MPREGHLDHVIYIFLFSYSKACHNLRIVLDLTYPDIVNMNDFKHYICKQFYGNGKELMPSNTPRLIEEEFIIQAFVDADFAGDNLTRRSRSSFLVMLNNIALLSFSKKQSSMETSSFGRKFVAIRQCCEYLKGLQYELRMMGIPVNNPCFIYGDYQLVLQNTTVPDLMLKKKTAYVLRHLICEGVSADEWRTLDINNKFNQSDIFIKNLPAGENRYRKVRIVLFDINL